MKISITCEVKYNPLDTEQSLLLKSLQYDLWTYLFNVKDIEKDDVEVEWNGELIDISTERIDTLVNAFEKGYIHKQKSIYNE